ncbi:MAG: hypothetical protein Q4C53_05755 [Clostridia bacterium]|nr:hypothetical protein [Clostridia bacterium]
MYRDEVLLELYRGRPVCKEVFDRWFCTQGSNCIAILEDEFGRRREIDLTLRDGKAADISFYKAVMHPDARETCDECQFTLSEKQDAFDILDRCFPNRAQEELEPTIARAVAAHAEFEGYRILSRVKGGVKYRTPDGQRRLFAELHILRALDRAHTDLAMLADPYVAHWMMHALGKAPYQPLYAVLQYAAPETWPNYAQLTEELRRKTGGK